MSEEECLQLLLSYGESRKDWEKLADALLKRYGSMRNIITAGLNETIQMPGMGVGGAVLIEILHELIQIHPIYTIFTTRENEKRIETKEECVEQLRLAWYFRLRAEKTELFEAVYFGRNFSISLKNFDRLARGGSDSVHCAPQQILMDAIGRRSRYVVVCHNHPSGNMFPSDADRELTDYLLQILANVNITLLDHIIVTSNNVYSIMENRDVTSPLTSKIMKSKKKYLIL